ncbi:hypothetical protein UY3_05907 [Chelonia mydas]|uniref:Uncharacterized protein n=1 Tax=Chelonia mydas TaxID=8469 RepID=M7C8M4_CHEMY|nr:hypothetical protein UY3_05907 [Chelonia mydas]
MGVGGSPQPLAATEVSIQDVSASTTNSGLISALLCIVQKAGTIVADITLLRVMEELSAHAQEHVNRDLKSEEKQRCRAPRNPAEVNESASPGPEQTLRTRFCSACSYTLSHWGHGCFALCPGFLCCGKLRLRLCPGASSPAAATVTVHFSFGGRVCAGCCCSKAQFQRVLWQTQVTPFPEAAAKCFQTPASQVLLAAESSRGPSPPRSNTDIRCILEKPLWVKEESSSFKCQEEAFYLLVQEDIEHSLALLCKPETIKLCMFLFQQQGFGVGETFVSPRRSDPHTATYLALLDLQISSLETTRWHLEEEERPSWPKGSALVHVCCQEAVVLAMLGMPRHADGRGHARTKGALS